MQDQAGNPGRHISIPAGRVAAGSQPPPGSYSRNDVHARSFARNVMWQRSNPATVRRTSRGLARHGRRPIQFSAVSLKGSTVAQFPEAHSVPIKQSREREIIAPHCQCRAICGKNRTNPAHGRAARLQPACSPLAGWLFRMNSSGITAAKRANNGFPHARSHP